MPRVRAPTPRRTRVACLAALDACPPRCSFADDYYTSDGGSATAAAVLDLWSAVMAGQHTYSTATAASSPLLSSSPHCSYTSLSSSSSSLASRCVPARHCECCDAAAAATTTAMTGRASTLAALCTSPSLAAAAATTMTSSTAAAATDVYDRAREVARQEQFVRESSRLAGPFVPACAAQPLRTPTRLLLGDCVRALYRVLACDWHDAAPRLVTTCEDLLVVSFATHTLAPRRVRALRVYMSGAPQCTAVLRRFALRPVRECWHAVTRDERVLYALRPPWVRAHQFVYVDDASHMNPHAAQYTPSFVQRRPHTTHADTPQAHDCRRDSNEQHSECGGGGAVTPVAAAAVVVAVAAKRVYTRAQLLALQPHILAAAARGPLVDVPPFVKVPVSAAALLRLPYALEVVDVDAVSALVASRQYRSPLLSPPPSPPPPLHASSLTLSPSSSPVGRGAAHHAEADEAGDVSEAAMRAVECAVCARGGARPCAAMQTLMRNVVKYAVSTRAGACLMQSGEVVWSLLQLALVFDAKQSSLRMRMLAERHPAVVRRVAAYLCGDDDAYLMPLPAVADHVAWRGMLALLKFDALRDNTTRIITDTSRHWRRRSTPFEQFVFFFRFRDDRPRAPVRNTITRSVKPGMVAMLCGDVVAMVLLHRLGFFIPPDYYWHVFPFLRDALGAGSLTHDVVRHLARYLAARQDANLYNPLGEPFVSRAAAAAAAATRASACVATVDDGDARASTRSLP